MDIASLAEYARCHARPADLDRIIERGWILTTGGEPFVDNFDNRLDAAFERTFGRGIIYAMHQDKIAMEVYRRTRQGEFNT